MYKFQTIRIGSGTGTSFLGTFDQDGLEAALDDAFGTLGTENRELPVRINVYDVDDPKNWGASLFHIDVYPDNRLEFFHIEWMLYPEERRRTDRRGFEEQTGLSIPDAFLK